MYLHSSVDPSLIHFFGELPGLGLALVLDVVVPEAEQECEWSRNLVSNFSTGRGLTRGPFITIRLRRTPCSDVSNGVSNDSQACSVFQLLPKTTLCDRNDDDLCLCLCLSLSLSLSYFFCLCMCLCQSVSFYFNYFTLK